MPAHLRQVQKKCLETMLEEKLRKLEKPERAKGACAVMAGASFLQQQKFRGIMGITENQSGRGWKGVQAEWEYI